jgi:hypothetical protein
LFTLIAFSVVSCAGPNKSGWTRRDGDFRQDKFEEDRKRCVQFIDQDPNSEGFEQALKQCLARKGYNHEATDLGDEDKQKLKTLEKVLLISACVGLIVLIGLAGGGSAPGNGFKMSVPNSGFNIFK